MSEPDYERMDRLNAIRAELGFAADSATTCDIAPDATPADEDLQGCITINKGAFGHPEWEFVKGAFEFQMRVLREDMLVALIERRRRLGLPTS